MKKKTYEIFKGIIVLLIVIIDAYPIFWLLTSAMKAPTEFTSSPSYALPKGFYFQNFVNAWTRGHMGRYFLNSLLYTVISLFFIVLIAVPVSFALTKMRWKGRSFFANYFLTGLMVPVATALLPLFRIYGNMGILNTRLCLILTYVAFGLSLSIFLMSGYMRSLSDEILEASVIDGCGIFSMMWYIVVPLMKNGIVTVLVLQFFYKWNDLLFSMTFISDSKLKTIQTGLLYFTNEFGTKDWGSIFASIAISVLPMLVIYLVLNRTVVEGMTSGAVKG
ncbi:carbohydrate ABC transporter permease [Bilifractor sp. LCP21S3_A7]|uniref:carbohydrate ABC transporter permease n=1 Tax=Bilifractor sp. LCP21S3_A7 TaxID=3438738 RepID=UPI003F8EC587